MDALAMDLAHDSLLREARFQAEQATEVNIPLAYRLVLIAREVGPFVRVEHQQTAIRIERKYYRECRHHQKAA